ncbi:hypothetical protein LUZ60_003330 [Juncus effusus]|nr:hypothetical protein LUZ60_003330 [Juncus effusus]
MGDEGGGGDFASPPAAKRLKRVAEMVMVLSAMAGMRGGRDPTPVEKAMAAEARESLTGLCEKLKPKDLFPREAVRAVVEDLGLSKDVGIGFKPPRISISEKILQTKRKLEGPKEVTMHQNPYFPSPNFGTNQIGGVHSQPISSSASQRPQFQEKNSVIKPGIGIPLQSGISIPRSDPLKQNGPPLISQSKVTPQVQNQQKDKSAEKPKSDSSTNEKLPGGVQQPNLLIGLPAQQGSSLLTPPQSVYSTHTEISKKVQKIVQSKRDTSHPLWTPPSTDYMTKATMCMSCNVMINDFESLLICDACEKGTHLKCLESSYGSKISLPKAEWHCQKCLVTSQGKALPPKYGKVTRTVGPPKIAPPVKKENVVSKLNGNPSVVGVVQMKPQNDVKNPKNAVTNPKTDGKETVGVVKKESIQNNGEDGNGVDKKEKEKGEKSVTENPGIEIPGNEDLGNGNQGNGIPESREIKWVGEAGEVIDGKIHYSACSINNMNYKLQDHVLISSEGNRLIPSKIKSLWESKEQNSKSVIVNPYYLPSDLPESVSCSSGGVEENEVYASDNKQVISLELISGKCEVLSNDKFQVETEKRGKLNDDNLPLIFLCRWKYDDTNGILRPLTN